MRYNQRKTAFLTLLLLFPSSAFCDLTGNWTITRIIKTTELQLAVKGARPVKSMGLVQTNYQFNADGTITTSGGNSGTWKENSKGDFAIFFDKKIQAKNLEQALTDQGFAVNSVKIVKDSIKGIVYPEGIIGTSNGAFTIDVKSNQGNYKSKVSVTFSFAGIKPQSITTFSAQHENTKLQINDEMVLSDNLLKKLSSAISK
jgi:hypothetical protein